MPTQADQYTAADGCLFSGTKIRNNIINKTQVHFRMCCWNVRTLLDLDSPNRPERRTALIAKELDRYNIDVAALSETRFSDEGQLDEIGCGYSFFWIGKPEGERRDGGVGFAVRTKLVRQLDELPTGVNDRILKLRLPLTHGRYVTFLSVYAPTMSSCEDKISSFYESLKATIISIPAEDKIVLSGDFNARVGREHETWGGLGLYGIGKMNSNGTRLLQLCSELNLAIGNTFFHQKPRHKVTWTHPRSKQGHLIDYVIVRKRDLRDLCSVRVMRGATCWTDHNLVRAKLKFFVRMKTRHDNTSVPKRLNVSKLKDPVISKSLSDGIHNITFDGSWVDFKQQVYATSSDILGFKVRKHKDWFDENNEIISELLHTKRALHQKLLNPNISEAVKLSTKKSLSEHKASLQRELRIIKNTWWSGIAADIQSAFDRKDTKTVYSLLKGVFGPRQPSISPLKSKDGSMLIKDAVGISKRWTEHFTDLFHNPSIVNIAIIEGIQQHDIITEMDIIPVEDEISLAVKQQNTGRAPGIDGNPVEVVQHGGQAMINMITTMITDVWQGAPVPQDWKDAILVSLFKGKGLKSNCGDFRGISLLVTVGKVFSRVLLNRLLKHICPIIIPESQCGFRSGRGTADMIFTARQLQEKCIEQRLPLYQVFVDLTKAFDTVNRDALWRILEKLGCPPTFVDMFRQLHTGMKAQLNFNGSLSDPIPVDNGVKQGDIPAPTLFSIYFAVVLLHAFGSCDIGIFIRYRTTGKLFDLRRFNAKSKTFSVLVRDLLYADDCDLVAHSAEDLQVIVDLFSNACSDFGLSISIKKTQVMFTPAPGEPYAEPDIFVEGTRLAVVDSFVYLGSSLSRDGSLDSEVNRRIGKACVAFGKLEDRVWSDHDLTLSTKLSVYDACVVTSLLFACETWTTYRRHLKILERFHQNCLRHILHINWKSLTADTEVLERASCLSIEARITLHHMRWVGHVIRMDDTRIPKQIFYGELVQGKRPPHKPRKRFRDCTKGYLKSLGYDVTNWEHRADDRTEWRANNRKRCQQFDEDRVRHEITKRRARKMHDIDIPEGRGSKHDLTCSYCGRILLSKAGLVGHVKSHERRLNQNSYVNLLPPAPPENTCPVCFKVCKSKSGLTRHMRVHQRDGNVIPEIPVGPNTCHICHLSCRSRAGLMSHLRSHGREAEQNK